MASTSSLRGWVGMLLLKDINAGMTDDKLREKGAAAVTNMMRLFSGANDAAAVLDELSTGNGFERNKYSTAAAVLAAELPAGAGDSSALQQRLANAEKGQKDAEDARNVALQRASVAETERDQANLAKNDLTNKLSAKETELAAQRSDAALRAQEAAKKAEEALTQEKAEVQRAKLALAQAEAARDAFKKALTSGTASPTDAAVAAAAAAAAASTAAVELARQQKEADEAAEEAERKRLEAKETERKRLEAEDAERLRMEAEEAQKSASLTGILLPANQVGLTTDNIIIGQKNEWSVGGIWTRFMMSGAKTFDGYIESLVKGGLTKRSVHPNGDATDSGGIANGVILAIVALQGSADSFNAKAVQAFKAGYKGKPHTNPLVLSEESYKSILNAFKGESIKIVDATAVISKIRDVAIGSGAAKWNDISKVFGTEANAAAAFLSKLPSQPYALGLQVGLYNDAAAKNTFGGTAEEIEAQKKFPGFSDSAPALKRIVTMMGEARKQILATDRNEPTGTVGRTTFVGDDIDDLMSGDVAATRAPAWAPVDTQVPVDVALAARVGAPAEQSAGSLWNTQPAAAAAAPSVADALASFFGGGSTAQ